MQLKESIYSNAFYSHSKVCLVQTSNKCRTGIGRLFLTLFMKFEQIRHERFAPSAQFLEQKAAHNIFLIQVQCISLHGFIYISLSLTPNHPNISGTFDQSFPKIFD